MRTTKFRGKQIVTGRWLEGSLLRRGNRCFIIPFDGYPQAKDTEVDPETAGEAPINNPWRCAECGSLNIVQRVWADPNTGKATNWEDVEDDDCWCHDCEAHTDQIEEEELMETIEEWWGYLEGSIKEDVTGVEYDRFHIGDSDDELQDADCRFSAACQEKWDARDIESKIGIWHELTRDKSNDS